MVSPTQATNAGAVLAALNGGASSPAAASSVASASAQATQNQFMKLLVTQLKNQDPLNPMDNAQMTSQMAQINTVSGIAQLNTTLQALSASLTPNQTVQAAGMIGHGAMVPGGGISLVSGSPGMGGFSLPSVSDATTVSIYDSTGALVNTLNMGVRPAGVTDWQWDGTNGSGAAMPAGNYSFKVNATLAGNPVAANTLQYGVINSVTQGATGLTLGVGSLQNIALTQIQQVL
jgi:flagellar basal-body rod modification protein FlgD